MSAREDVDRLLAEHERILGGPSNLPMCSCGTVVPPRTGLLPWHRAHVAQLLGEAGLLGKAPTEPVDWPQLAWDALGILGFDLDGDATPAAVVDFPTDFMARIREMRSDYDEACEAVSDTWDAAREAGYAEALIAVERYVKAQSAGMMLDGARFGLADVLDILAHLSADREARP